MSSKGEASHPPFAFELPDGWVGGYRPIDYVEALVDHARAHPDDQDRAFELMATAAGAEDILFMAGAVRGPRAGLAVVADAMQPGGLLSVDDELDAWVDGNLDVLTPDDGVAGDPIMSLIEEPYAGRELRWSQSFEEGPPMTCMSYCYATAGRVWTLSFEPFDPFDPQIGSPPILEGTLRAIALSFRVIQPGT